MTTTKLSAAALAVSIALVQTPALAGGSHSGGHGDSHADSHIGGHHAANIGQAGKADRVDRTVEVKMGEMFFEPGGIAVRKGETVRFVVTNTGEFVHEFNIGTAAMHQAHADEMVAMMELGVLEANRIDHDKMMEMGMAHDDASSVLLEPGQTAEVIWAFTGDAQLEMSCNVPGHRESGMKGAVAVKPSGLGS